MTSTIKKVKKPKGYEGNYTFFENLETGRRWKARLVASHPNVNTFGVTITVSPVDEDGKALMENGEPIVTDSIGHGFNEIEMKEPDFSAEARLMEIVQQRINVGERRFEGVKKITDLLSAWSN